jgi:DNA-binding transcriptional regulator GbsR (MarR family)
MEPEIPYIPLGAYNPSQVPRDVLLAEFTARAGLVDDLLDILRGNAPNHPCQHSLLMGPRGYGKTTTLYAMKYRLEDDPKLIKKWIPLLFDEENYHLGDLAGFWLECLRLAEIALQTAGPVTYLSLHTSRDPKLEDQSREAFLALLARAKRRAVLLVDNLNDVLAAVADDSAQHRLRAFLLEESRVCVVGTACTYFSAISSTDRPFYQLFRVFRLDSFNPTEMETALRAMAAARPLTSARIKWPTQAGYWKGLHILTGGNPRLVKIIYQLMERGVTADFQCQLEGLLDAYTPYFKHRIEAMSPQQRRVFDAIALAWNAVEISEIAPALRMDSNQISAQVKALLEAQLVSIRGGTARRRTYQVADRFSNIYYFMRFSRAGRSKFEWFIRTMKIILTPDQYSEQLDQMRFQALGCSAEDTKKLQLHLLATATQFIDDATSRLNEGHKSVEYLLTAEQHEALTQLLAEPASKATLAGDYDAVSYLTKLPKEKLKEIGYEPKSADWWGRVGKEFFKAKHLHACLESFKKARNIEPSNPRYWSMLGATQLTSNPKEAEAALRKAIGLRTAEENLECKFSRHIAIVILAIIPPRTPARLAEAREMAIAEVLVECRSELGVLAFRVLCLHHVDSCRRLLTKASTDSATTVQEVSELKDGRCPFALDVLATIIAAGHDKEAEAAINASPTPEAFDVALQAIRLRADKSYEDRLAPERLALASAYLEIIETRKEEIAKTEQQDTSKSNLNVLKPSKSTKGKIEKN